MGPVNWLAVIMAAILAVTLRMVWHGVLFRTGRPLLTGGGGENERPRSTNFLIVLAVMLLATTMLGHNYARLGAQTLAAKPWLYWMQSGGLAVAFVIPAVWLGYVRTGASRRLLLVDGGFWLAAYLAMGTVFWALR
jgi:hypothetical protein